MARLNFHRLMGYLIYLLHRSMIASLGEDFAKENVVVTVDQYRALCNIIDSPGNTQSWLVETLIQNKSYISRLADSLERNRLIKRTKLEGDGNQYNITATAKGEMVTQKCFEIAVRWNKRACEGIDPEELEICRKTMLKILKNLNSYRNF